MAKTEDDKSGVVKAFAIGAAISALAGYVAGILTAPKSGKETREDIRNRAQASYAAAEKELKKLHTELTDVLHEVGDRVESFKNRKDVDAALKKGQHAKQKAREVLSTLHEGEAEDEDLRKAIKDATDAIDHLRDFLKK